MRRQTEEGFWSRVKIGKPDECWPWQGGHSRGYGRAHWHQQHAYAHRLAAWLHGMVATFKAPRNKKGRGFVLHTCDNRICCNPKHLYVGTMKDNTQDAMRRGRWRDNTGTRNGQAKLTPRQVRTIRQRYAAGGVSQDVLAQQYGLSQSHISAILLRKKWRHI